MAVHKICGIETEYGIVHRHDGESNPVAASSTLINAYVTEHTERVGWDFEDESPGADARGYSEFDALAPEVETHLVNAVLTNGARYYVDHAHPEISTPECLDALEVLAFDRAAEEILVQSMRAVEASLPPGQEIIVYKNNSDRKGNSYGCHENYLLDRETPFGRIVTNITPHFITRQIYTGAGKVGTELVGSTSREVPFQITQRADFFEEEVGLETTLKRPIVNTRDEPHADSRKYRRLHVIVGDANLAETSTFLKVGTTSLVLAMIDDDFLSSDVEFEDPVHALQLVSQDLSLRLPLRLVDGRRASALELQWDLFDRAQKYADAVGLDHVGGDEVGTMILREWETTLTALESDPMQLADRLDWVAKLRLYEGFMERHGIEWDDSRLAAMDLQYHDMRPEKSLFRRLDLRRLVDDEATRRAMTEPPDGTRAYFRGRCLQKYPEAIVAANWDSLVFDVGTDPLRRVPMMEPLRGTAQHVGRLLDESETAAELLERLGS
ncbi:MAG: depupylase/deamidase Dop [Actinomycetota bacterium]